MSIVSLVARKIKREGQSAFPEVKDLSLVAAKDAEVETLKRRSEKSEIAGDGERN